MKAIRDKSVDLIWETAAEWAARLDANDLTNEERSAFAAWLRASPAHLREYLNVEALRESLRGTLRADDTAVADLLREEHSNVVALELASREPAMQAPKSSCHRARTYGLAAAGLLVAAIGLALHSLGFLKQNVYATDIGETRRIALADGSIVELNTGSEISVRIDGEVREIDLAKGEAFFSVAKDATRPFRVLSDSVMVRAIGTQFSVHRKSGGTIVTVVEGKVAAQGEGRPVELTAGQQVTMASRSARRAVPVRAENIDAVRATAWRQHRLIFDNQPLAEVVAEFNRYNRQKLVVADPELAAQGISGVFDPDKPQGLLLFLDKKGGVKAIDGADSTLMLVRQSGAAEKF
jgi:transmembrane sensor